MTALNHPSIHHEQSLLTLYTVALIFLFQGEIFPTLTHNTYPNYLDHIVTSLKRRIFMHMDTSHSV